MYPNINNFLEILGNILKNKWQERNKQQEKVQVLRLPENT